jgi:hypothetical protein
MAVAHLEEARGFIRESRSSEGHTKALGAVGKALALDPRNAQAKQMLVSLITDESRAVPKDAQSEINLLGDECFGFAVNMAYKAYAAVGLTFLVYALATLSTRTWEPWLASLLWCAAAYVTHLAKDGLRTRPWIPVTNLVLSNMGILAAALVFGSTQVVPLLCLANTCGLVLGGPAELRKQAVAAGLGVMGALAMADTAGLLPQPLLEVQSYALGNTGALASSRTLGVLLVSVMHMIILLCTGAIVGAMRTHLLDLQTRLFLHGWRLRRLFSNREA